MRLVFDDSRSALSARRPFALIVASFAMALALAGLAGRGAPARAEAVRVEAGRAAVAEVPGVPTVTTESEDRLLNGVKYLASEELEGRGVGSKGLDLAAEFVRNEFQKAGLDVARVNNEAFQKFSMVTGTELTSPNTLQFTLADGKTIELKHGADYQTCSFGGAGTFSGELVFCGYGIEEKEPKYNDFDGIDVKGKIVVLMRRTPQQSDPHSPFGPHGKASRQADLRTKVSNAVNKGAAAIVVVNDPHSVREAAKTRVEQKKKKEKEAAEKAAKTAGTANGGATSGGATNGGAADDVNKTDAAKTEATKTEATKTDATKTDAAKTDATKTDAAKTDAVRSETVAIEAADDVLMTFGYGGRGTEQSLPIVHVRQSVVDELLKASQQTDLAALESAIDKELKPQSKALPVKATGQTALKLTKAEVKNVLAALEGAGPLADETIVVGAHYDHVGRGGEGSLANGSKEIHNGADDNASGSSALLEVARRLVARKEKLPRRVVFIAFTGEELGLIGSARYVKEPVFPLEKTIAMFNMDMVGRLKEDQKLIVYGTGTSSRWKGQIDELGATGGFHIIHKPEGFGPSDHSSFYAKKIPVLHFFTGDHRDYHRPGDDWEKINVDGMSRVVDLVEQLVVRTATTPERPDYIEVKQKAGVNRDSSRPYFGSIPDFGNETPGYAISGVAAGSPADLGGLKGGDVIVEIGKNKVTGLDDFDLALRKFKPGEEVDVVVLRKGERTALKVKLVAPK